MVNTLVGGLADEVTAVAMGNSSLDSVLENGATAMLPAQQQEWPSPQTDDCTEFGNCRPHSKHLSVGSLWNE